MLSRGCSGVVLAGGRSTRFNGIAKGLLEVGGRRIVDRVCDSLGNAVDELLLITNDIAVRRALPDVPTFGDVRVDRGSLVGLHSALVHGGEAILAVAWDMPFLSSELLSLLRAHGEATASAVFPEGAQGPEPLCAYYPRSCIAIVEEQLQRGEMRLASLVETMPSRVIIPLHDVARFGKPEILFANVNSAADLAKAQWVCREISERPTEARAKRSVPVEYP
jgi:molybdopterin-guanine dinucleotide biosynthesis protein A